MRQYQIEIDPRALDKYRFSVRQLADTVKSNNRNAGGALLDAGQQSLPIRGSGLIRSIEDIEQIVRDRTGGQIYQLRVEIGPDGARMHGRCSTYYCKQLAQHAAMRLLGPLTLSNEIEVG